MESRSIEPKDPGIIFDLLKGWISDSFHRTIKDSTPPGCPWQALASALQESSRQQCRNQSSLDGLSDEKRYTEFEVRESLVNIYTRQTEGVRRAIAQAKLEDPPSIFSLDSYQNAKEVMNHWNWYLSCLCGTQQELEIMRMPTVFVAYDELRPASVHGDLSVAGTVYLLAAKPSSHQSTDCLLYTSPSPRD